MPVQLHVTSFAKSLSVQDKEELLRHFGAVDVQQVVRRGKDVAAVARFKSESDCEFALKRLHQLEVLGTRLVATYEDSCPVPLSQQPHRKEVEQDSKPKEPSRQERIRRKIREFESQLSALGPNFSINHPIPHSLKYLYPPPSPCIIANIAQTLVAVPKFYTQVLHLMNKMNLPTPFGDPHNLPPVYDKVLNILNYERKDARSEQLDSVRKTQQFSDTGQEQKENENRSPSSSESELESDSDETEKKKRDRHLMLPVRRKLKPKNVINKKPKLSQLRQLCPAGPRTSEPASVSDVFECSEGHVSRKLKLNLQGTVLPAGEEMAGDTELGEFGKISSAMESGQVEGVPGEFGKISCVSKTSSRKKGVEDMVEWQREASKYITLEQLQDNRVAKSDWPLLPVFKNYTPGEPSTKLYIKNLAKTTKEEDLKYIFGRYIFWQNDEEANMFSIRVMKEGRMKGQAFVTFPTVQQATQALHHTNGYILHDKPLVVVFGKVKKE